MSEKTARTYTQHSNRERPRNSADRKVVFKPVFDNPFRIRWPSVPINLQNSILSHLLSLLEGASDYHHSQCHASRKRKRQDGHTGPRKLRKRGDQRTNTGKNGDLIENTEQPMEISRASSDPGVPPKPPILDHLISGINAVTKRLESQARQIRRTVIASNVVAEKHSDLQAPLSIIFICRSDIDPPLLIEHIPHLVASCNSVKGKHYIKLVPLPKESESKLASALGIRRAAIIGLDSRFPGLPELAERLESVPLLTAPWFTIQPPVQQHLVPTHVKQLRTSAPKDMKGTKQTRIQEKAAAKAKQKEKLAVRRRGRALHDPK